MLLIDSKTLLQLTPGLRKNPILDEDDYGETVSTLSAINFTTVTYPSTQGRNIYDLTSTLVESTIGYQHTDEKEGSKEGERYNRTVRGYCNGRLPNERI